MSLEHFFETAIERENIRRRKEAGWEPQTWTEDPIFRQWRFCNVHRENDRVTRWFREHIREPLRNNKERVFQATVAFRWFNLPEIGEVYRDFMHEEWFLIRNHFHHALKKRRAAGHSQVVTGAYLIATPPGMNKLDGVMHCIDETMKRTHLINYICLRNCHNILRTFPQMGRFMAYEVVTDLRHTACLKDAADTDTWASFGPGAARGLKEVFGGDLLPYQSRAGQNKMLDLGRELLARVPDFWPSNWQGWEMREVEHWLCEHAKYCAAQRGKRQKRRYKCVT